MKITLSLAAVLLMVNLSFAQDTTKVEKERARKTYVAPTPEERAAMQTKRMTDQLSLTTDQQKQVEELTLRQANANKKLAETAKADREEYNNELKDTHSGPSKKMGRKSKQNACSCPENEPAKPF